MGLVDGERRDGRVGDGVGIGAGTVGEHGEVAPVQVGGEGAAAVDQSGQGVLDEEDVGALKAVADFALVPGAVGEDAEQGTTRSRALERHSHSATAPSGSEVAGGGRLAESARAVSGTADGRAGRAPSAWWQGAGERSARATGRCDGG
ncbi:hypothetical protein GCM10010398_74280 [Streptomyces fimbriatus]